MAALAVRQTAVTEVHVSPTLGVMAIGTLSRIVIGLAVTTGAVHQSRVIKVRVTPILGSVASATFPAVVIDRGCITVAVRAHISTDVIEMHILPILGVMACRAGIAGEVIGFWCFVTRLAIRKSRVIEPRILPIQRIVTTGALSRIVILRRIFFQVT